MIKNWNLFKKSIDNEWEIHKICKKYGIKNYTINDDLSIDVDGDVDLYGKNLDKIPLKFNNVNGYFNISTNNLTSLEFCPKFIDRSFYCDSNNLTSLEFCPKVVKGDFNCDYNQIKYLNFVPERVDGYFSILNNYLTSLENLPKSIGGDIYCQYNKIWIFRGIPDSFRGNLYCDGNPIWNIWNLFKSPKDIEFLNDCHVLREPESPEDLPIVVLERLNFFLETIGKPTVEGVEGYINI